MIHIDNGGIGGGGSATTDGLVPYSGAVADVLLSTYRLSAAGVTCGTLQGILAGSDGTVFSIGSTGAAGTYLTSDGDNTYSWSTIGTGSHDALTIGVPSSGLVLSSQELTLKTSGTGVDGALSGTDWDTFNGKFNTVTTGILSGLLPITTDTTRYVLGGTLQMSLNTANIWATTFSGTNWYGGTFSGGTVKADTLSGTTLYATTISGTNIYATTFSGTTVKADTLSSTTLYSTNISAGTIYATNYSGTTIKADTLSATTLYATTVSATNIYATTFSGTTYKADTITSTTINSTNINFTGHTSGGTLFATAITCGTLQGILVGTGGTIQAISGTGVVGNFLYVSGGNTYAWADTSASLPTITTGIISGLLPITTDSTRYVLGGALVVSLNTATLWATTLSSTNINFGGTASGGTVLATLPLTKSFVVYSPPGAATYPVWKTPRAVTITSGNALVLGGVSLTGQLQEADADGGNGVEISASGVIATGTNTGLNITNAAVDANDYILWVTTATSGGPTSLTVSFSYV